MELFHVIACVEILACLLLWLTYRLLVNRRESARQKFQKSKQSTQAISEPKLIVSEKILEKLVTYMDFETLASGRLVCKEWNRLCTPPFESKSRLTLDLSAENSKMEKFWEKFVAVFPLYNDGIVLTPPIPSQLSVTFMYVSVALYERGQSVDNKSPGVKKLLSWLVPHGSKIRDLEIRIGVVRYSIMIHKPDITFVLLRKFLELCGNLETFRMPLANVLISPTDPDLPPQPNMKTLEIGMGFSEGETVSCYPLIRKLLASCPNVTSLNMARLMCFKRDHPERELPVEDGAYFENLVDLALAGCFFIGAPFRRLSQFPFQALKKLTLSGLDDNPPRLGPVLAVLLINVRDKLEELRMGMYIPVSAVDPYADPDEHEPPPVRQTFAFIPLMEKLKVFEYCGPISAEQTAIRFLERFPSLGRLILSCESDKKTLATLFPADPDFQHSALRALEIPKWILNERNVDRALTKIRRTFPNLESLSIPLPRLYDNLAFFETIAEYAKLKELYVTGSDISGDDFNTAIRVAFGSNEYCDFSRLECFGFDCGKASLPLQLLTVVEVSGHARSLRYLEFKGFQIKDSEKQAIFERLSRISKVKLLNCRVGHHALGKLRIETEGREMWLQPPEKKEIWKLELGSGFDLTHV